MHRDGRCTTWAMISPNGQIIRETYGKFYKLFFPVWSAIA